MMTEIPVHRWLSDIGRLEDVIINDKLYSAYITTADEICITDSLDKTKIYAVMCKGLYRWITEAEEELKGEREDV